jgi:CBS domain-containing protein
MKVLNIFSRKNKVLVVDAMNNSPKTISPDATVLEASKKMIDTGKGSLIVVKGDALLGIITKTDVIENTLLKKKNPNMKVSEVMTRRHLSISPNKTISEAAKIMVDYGVRRLPVVEKGKLKGLITQTDLLKIQPAIIDLLVEKFVQEDSVSDIRALKGVKGVCDICGELAYLEEHNEGMLCKNCMDAMQ